MAYVRDNSDDFCNASREACELGCNPNRGDCRCQDLLVPNDNRYDSFLNGNIEGVKSGRIATIGIPNRVNFREFSNTIWAIHIFNAMAHTFERFPLVSFEASADYGYIFFTISISKSTP